MNTNDTTFGKIEDETGSAYYCPINSETDDRPGPHIDRESCVEASTVERYSGNLEVPGRFTDR